MKLSPCVDPSSTTPYVTDCKQYMAFLKSLFSTKNKTVSQSLNRIYPNTLPAIPTFIDLVCYWNHYDCRVKKYINSLQATAVLYLQLSIPSFLLFALTNKSKELTKDIHSPVSFLQHINTFSPHCVPLSFLLL